MHSPKRFLIFLTGKRGTVLPTQYFLALSLSYGSHHGFLSIHVTNMETWLYPDHKHRISMDMFPCENGFMESLTGHLDFFLLERGKMAVSVPILPCYPIDLFSWVWNVKKYEFCFCKTSPNSTWNFWNFQKSFKEKTWKIFQKQAQVIKFQILVFFL